MWSLPAQDPHRERGCPCGKPHWRLPSLHPRAPWPPRRLLCLCRFTADSYWRRIFIFMQMRLPRAVDASEVFGKQNICRHGWLLLYPGFKLCQQLHFLNTKNATAVFLLPPPHAWPLCCHPIIFTLSLLFQSQVWEKSHLFQPSE